MTEIYEYLNLFGLDIAYIDRGPRDSSDVVVLLHDGAYGSSAELAWADVIAELSEEVRVPAPDLLGYGKSAKLAFFDRAPHVTQSEYARRFCQALGVQDKRIHLVGTSFGGSVVIRAATEHAAEWSMTSAVTIAGTAGYGRNADVFAQLQDYDQSLEDARRITALLVNDVDSWEDHVSSRHRNGLIPGHWESLAAAKVRAPERTSPSRVPIEEVLGSCSVPMLFMEGKADQLLQPRWTKVLADLAPKGAAVTVSGAHSPNIDHAGEVAAVLLDFVRNI